MPFGKKAYEEIRKIKRDSGVGYIETDFLRYDGNDALKERLDMLVKITDPPIDLSKVTKIIGKLHPLAATRIGMPTMVEFLKDDLVYTSDGDAEALLTGSEMGDMPLVVSCTRTGAVEGANVGTYVLSLNEILEDGGGEETAMWVSYVEFAETVHTIDPMFLPSNIGGGQIDTDAFATKEYVGQLITGAMEASY